MLKPKNNRPYGNCKMANRIGKTVKHYLFSDSPIVDWILILICLTMFLVSVLI